MNLNKIDLCDECSYYRQLQYKSELDAYLCDLCYDLPIGKESIKMNLEYVTYETLKDVELERIKQNVKWGRQRHNHGAWLAILMEEVGEVAQAMQNGMFSQKETDADNLYEELIQVAAVAVAIAEQVKEESKNDQ